MSHLNKNGCLILASVLIENPTNMSSIFLQLVRDDSGILSKVYLEKICTTEGDDSYYDMGIQTITEDDILKLQRQVLTRAEFVVRQIVNVHAMNQIELWQRQQEAEHLSDQIVDQFREQTNIHLGNIGEFQI